MRNYSVLICDDNIAVHKSIGAYLEEEGIGVFSVYDGESAVTALRDNSIDLVILDIILPGTDCGRRAWPPIRIQTYAFHIKNRFPRLDLKVL